MKVSFKKISDKCITVLYDKKEAGKIIYDETNNLYTFHNTDDRIIEFKLKAENVEALQETLIEMIELFGPSENDR